MRETSGIKVLANWITFCARLIPSSEGIIGSMRSTMFVAGNPLLINRRMDATASLGFHATGSIGVCPQPVIPQWTMAGICSRRAIAFFWKMGLYGALVIRMAPAKDGLETSFSYQEWLIPASPRSVMPIYFMCIPPFEGQKMAKALGNTKRTFCKIFLQKKVMVLCYTARAFGCHREENHNE